jgi:predicted enzyme related to lactoylglutathione lyase
MPTRDVAPKGAPCWFDLASSDTDKSTAFYGELFGWTAEAPNEEFGGYINFQHGGSNLAGCMANDGSMGPDGWSVYLATDDIVKLAESVATAGGQVMMPPMAVGDLGQMAFFTDAGGAVIGAWQAGEHEGFRRSDAPGTPSWFELHTRDFDATLAFYRDALGLGIEMAADEPGFRYAIALAGGEQVAGIMDAGAFLPEGVPAHWSVYINVEDAAATVAKAQELGGTLVHGPDETPYGTLATIADPTGAMIKIQRPPAEG